MLTWLHKLTDFLPEEHELQSNEWCRFYAPMEPGQIRKGSNNYEYVLYHYKEFHSLAYKTLEAVLDGYSTPQTFLYPCKELNYYYTQLILHIRRILIRDDFLGEFRKIDFLIYENLLGSSERMLKVWPDFKVQLLDLLGEIETEFIRSGGYTYKLGSFLINYEELKDNLLTFIKKHQLQRQINDHQTLKTYPINFRWSQDKLSYLIEDKSIKFGRINSTRYSVFKILESAKGNYVETSLISKETGKSGDNIKAVVNQLNNQIKEINLQSEILIEARNKAPSAYRIIIYPAKLTPNS